MRELHSTRHLFASFAAIAAMFLGTAPVTYAEEGSSRYLEEIIVTGTKRATGQQDTPIAVSTLTADQIANTFVNDVRAVADLAPNVLLTKQPGFNALSGGIRGTGSTSILVLQDTSVGITIDDFVISSVQSQFVELFDVEQVEVYRGPQGTLFGKNSTGGVIAITSKRPSLDEFGGDLEVTFGQFDAYGGNTDVAKIAAAVDLPLIEGKLGFRFAGVYDTYEGYYKNDKDTATFPNQIPWFDILGVPADAPLPDIISGPARGNGDPLDGKNVLAWKAKLLWQPTDNYEAFFTWEYLRDDSDSVANVHESPAGEGFLHPIFGFPAIGDIPGQSPYSTASTSTFGDEHTVDSDGFYLTQTLDLESVELKLIAGWRETEETLASNYTGDFFPLFDASRNLEREQAQVEFRAVTNLDGPINFVGGAVYFSDDVSFRSIASQGFSGFFLEPHPETGTLLDPNGVVNYDTDWITDPATNNRDQQRKSFAVYLDGTFDLSDRLSVTGGVRWTKDDKDFQALSGGGAPCNQYTRPIDSRPLDPSLPFDAVTNCLDIQSTRLSRGGITLDQYNPRDNPLPDEQFALNLDLNEKWDEVSWRVVVDYQVNDDQLLYGSVATGYISGGYTETCSTLVTCVPYDAETNINYEIGYKADFMDKTLRFNTAVFYTDFDDIQRNQVVPYTNSAGTPAQETLTVNAGKSEVYGIEMEATWLPTDRLTLRGSLGILEAKYKKFEFDPQPNNPDTGIVDFSGLDIPFASPLQINFDATYEIPLSTGGSIALNGNVNFQDEAETSPFDSLAAGGGSFLAPRDEVVVRQPTNTQIEKRTLVNASVTWRDANERYYVTAYGRNLTNEVKRVGANSVAFLWNFTVYGPPREFGVRVGVNFN
jgi:iron complex outermembrane receptor protein